MQILCNLNVLIKDVVHVRIVDGPQFLMRLNKTRCNTCKSAVMKQKVIIVTVVVKCTQSSTKHSRTVVRNTIHKHLKVFCFYKHVFMKQLTALLGYLNVL